MGNVLFIFLIIIVLGLLGGLLYLIWLPFKNRLQKSGKLTDKLSRRINWTFIILPCIIGVVIYSFKDYRTPSKERLEKVSDIKLPEDLKVLKDEYHDMLQDYCILYEIQLKNNSMPKLIRNIKASKFYNKNNFHNEAWTEKDFISVDSVKAVWSKSPKGYDFSRPYNRTTYNIELDTITNILKYTEGSD